MATENNDPASSGPPPPQHAAHGGPDAEVAAYEALLKRREALRASIGPIEEVAAEVEALEKTVAPLCGPAAAARRAPGGRVAARTLHPGALST